MNILDENIIDSQRLQLKSWRVPIRQIGYEVAQQGIKDAEIIPLLHRLNRPTFFTRDDDFYERGLRHAGYCLVHLNVRKAEVAVFMRRVLRHPSLNTKAKRMGCVVRASHFGLTVWRLHAETEEIVEWND